VPGGTVADISPRAFTCLAKPGGFALLISLHVYVGHDPLQAYSKQNCILMVLGGPKRYAIKMVFKWYLGVQKGMLKKWSLHGFGGSKKVCFKNGL